MPWITATTATRNATDTMIPSSVKNERSLLLHAVWRAWKIASESCIALKLNGKRDTGNGNRECRRHTFPVSPFPFLPSRFPLFVPQCFHRIEPRRLVGRVQPEHDPRQRRGHERGDHRAERH